jgi:hypothetical protein
VPFPESPPGRLSSGSNGIVEPTALSSRSTVAPASGPPWNSSGFSASPPQSLQEFSAAELANPVRKVCFNICLVLIFLRFSMLHQTLTYIANANLYLMYIVGLPPVLGVIICGGLKRTLRGRPALYWCAFAVWILLAVPFSSWMGASFALVNDYVRSDLSILFVVAGLTLTWRDCEKVMMSVALGTLAILATSRFFESAAADFGNRMGLQMGTVSNPNDYAAHLVLSLAFLLWLSIASKSKVLRILAFIGLGVGLVLILKTGSRGAEIGLGVAVMFYMFRATGRQRVALVVLVPFAIAGMLAFVPADTLRRLRSFSAGDDTDLGAVESAENREYLLKMSLIYTGQFPIFGVGPGQFASYEGQHNIIAGMTHGSWHETHNSFTEASSECGIPGGLLFIGGVISTLLLLGKTLKTARRRTDSIDIQNAVFCVFLGSLAFYVTIAFVNFAYFFYEPFLAGLAIAMARAAKEEFRLRDRQPADVTGQPLAFASPRARRPQIAR